MTDGRRYAFGPGARLRLRADFRKVFSDGKKFSGRYFSLYVLPDLLEKKIGFSVRKAIGGSVVRNRLRRRLREFYRLRRQSLKPGLLVVLPRAGAGELSRPACEEEIAALLEKAGQWQESGSQKGSQ